MNHSLHGMWPPVIDLGHAHALQYHLSLLLGQPLVEKTTLSTPGSLSTNAGKFSLLGNFSPMFVCAQPEPLPFDSVICRTSTNQVHYMLRVHRLDLSN